jgi:hypothetical protein
MVLGHRIRCPTTSRRITSQSGWPAAGRILRIRKACRQVRA